MDTIENIRSFLTVARLGSFSLAARENGTVPSVMSKRVSQLEHKLRTQLFHRSTRGLELTGAGRRYQQRFAKVLAELDSALDEAVEHNQLQEHLRIKCPTTLAVTYLSDVLIRFRQDNPGVRIDLILVDRSVNPIEEGYDLAIGALPATYPHVVDIPLCRLARTIVASPEYLEKRGVPRHPRDLAAHDAVNFMTVGTKWSFENARGSSSLVDVNCVFNANDSQVMLKAVLGGLGVAMISEHVVRDAIAEGELVQLLPEYTVPAMAVKAMVPESRMSSPAVKAVLEAIANAWQPIPPWDRPAR